MNTKPLSLKTHAINDYVLGAALLAVPPILHVSARAQWLYRLLGINLLTYNALTYQPLAIKRLLSVNAHHNVDRLNLGAIAVTGMLKPVRKDKSAGIFHLSIAAISLLNVLLTDWKRY